MKLIPINTKIDVDVFSRLWKKELLSMAENELVSFSNNMKHIKMENKTFADWVGTWLAWSELSSDEDIEMMYGGNDDTFLDIEE